MRSAAEWFDSHWIEFHSPMLPSPAVDVIRAIQRDACEAMRDAIIKECGDIVWEDADTKVADLINSINIEQLLEAK